MEENQVSHSTFIAEEKLIPRLKQSFELYKKNFVGLSILILFYNVIALMISTGAWSIGIGNLSNLGGSGQDEMLSQLATNMSSVALIVWLSVLWFFAYIILFIPIFVATIQSIKNAMRGEEILPWENFKYWLSQFFNIFKVYWYVFQYVFLFPAFILISGLGVILIGLISGIDALMTLGGILVGGATILWIIFMVYRWLRSTFRIYGAVDSEDFSKENFTQWLKETQGKVLRIFGNFFVLGLCLWLFGMIFWAVINTVTWVNPNEESLKIQEQIEAGELSFADLQEFSESVTGMHLLHGLLTSLIEVLWIVFATIFTYIFSLRIRDEYSLSQETLTIVDNETSSSEI